MAGWKSVPNFGSAEQFDAYGEPRGEFYSHQHDQGGYEDVVHAALAYVTAYELLGRNEKRLAKALIEHFGPSTDYYAMGTTERWKINADYYITLAKHLNSVLL